MRLSLRGAAAALLLALPLNPLPAAAHTTLPVPAPVPVPVPVPVERSAGTIPGEYIVTLKQERLAGDVVRALGIIPRFTYTDALNGFAAVLDPSLLRAVRTHPAVAAVEQNTRVGVHESATRAPAATWGLDRIDQRTLPLDDTFTTRGHGAGASAYILDTGIDYAHEEFGGRAVPGFDAVDDGRNGLDCHGHGTHVAGTVAGRTYGVAPEARVVAVRVLDCTGNGDKAQTIAGLDWVARNAERPAVLNASLGEERSTAVNNAATALSDRGILPVVSAGNDAVDACTASPASAARVLTVAASGRQDQQAGFSNWGRCVSLYAPGQSVESAKLGGGATTLSGTSMSSPHVTGVAALYLAAHPDARPAAVQRFIENRATPDVLTGVHANTPNRLLFTAGL